MAFRADESAQAGLQSAESYLLNGIRGDETAWRQSKAFFEDIIDELGPVIDTYPMWHPLVCNYKDHSSPSIIPSQDCGYRGLDHTVYFANGFITCPYDDGQRVLDSVEALAPHDAAYIHAERLDVKLYQMNANPILVRCDWLEKFQRPGFAIPLRVAMPLILMQEVPSWRDAEVAETWETMRPYLLGKPHGARSSLFIDQEAGQSIKKIWNLLINTGMFGNIRVDW